MLSVVFVAALAVHWPQGFFAHNNGIELPLIYGVGAIVLALTGPGLWSLDALLGLDALSQPRIELVALLVALAGGIANVLARRPAQPVAQAAPQRG
jgi:putative oxidoreductase